MDSPQLSVAIPTYNRANLLRVCLDHIAAQIEPDVEVVICDNASTDATPQVTAAYAQRHPFIRCVRNNVNLGTDANILRCLRVSRGRFIQLLSDDDVLLPGSIARVLETARHYDSAGFIYLNSKCFSGDFNPERLSKPHYRIDQDFVFKDKNKFLLYIGVQATFMSAMVLNRELFTRIPDPERFVGTNLLQAHIALSCAAAGAPNVVVARPCVAYRAGNSGGYNLYRVFAGNWKDVLFQTGVMNNFEGRTLRRVYAKTIKSFLRPMTVEMRLNNTAFDSSGFGALFKLTWMYPSAWFYLYPFIVMPKWMVRWAQKLIDAVRTWIHRSK